MSVIESAGKITEPQLQAGVPQQAKSGTKNTAPLFDDVAANTSTPFPSLAGC